MMKHISTMICCIAVLMCSTVMAMSENEPEHSVRAWEKIIEEFNLEAVDQLPAGITPLVVTSPEQLRKLLARSTSRPLKFHIDASDLRREDMLTVGESAALTESYVVLHETDSFEWPAIFHLYAKVWLVGSGSFWQISECDERVYFTGWLPWSGHEDEWSSHHIYSNNVRVEVEGGALFYGYILIPGIGEYRVHWYWYHIVIDYSLY